MLKHKRMRKPGAGAKRKAPTTALNALIFDNDLSTYYLQKHYGINTGYTHNLARRNVKSYSIRILQLYAKPLHMKWYVVGEKLLKLQKQYPPREAKDHREPNTKAFKKEKLD